MAFSTAGPKGLSSEINVTPLIDVLLVLLIIFMVIVPQASRGLDAVVPTHGNQSSTQPTAPVLVQVDASRSEPSYRLNGVNIGRDDLPRELQELLAPRAERVVLIQGDAGLDFKTISDLVDLGTLAGAQGVALITPGTSR
jgi:biopolymer transport protein TolR